MKRRLRAWTVSFGLLVAAIVPARAAARPLGATAGSSGYLGMPDGIRLYWRRVGDATATVVMLHGGPGSDMDSSFPELAPLARDRSLLFYDQRGGGRSGPVADLSSVTAAQHVRDLEAIRQAFGLERLVLFGHSWGGGLAMLYAMEHPSRVERIVLVAPLWPRFRPYAELYERTMRARLGADYSRYVALLDSIASASDPAAPCREFFALYLRATGTGERGIRGLRGDPCAADPAVTRTFIERNRVTMRSLGEYDWRGRLSSIRAPTLVLQGTRDVLTESSTREWAAFLPEARLLLIPGAGHLPYADRPDEFYGAVDAFLRGRWPARAAVVARTR
jgi:proline iminopeptidase